VLSRGGRREKKACTRSAGHVVKRGRFGSVEKTPLSDQRGTMGVCPRSGVRPMERGARNEKVLQKVKGSEKTALALHWTFPKDLTNGREDFVKEG